MKKKKFVLLVVCLLISCILFTGCEFSFNFGDNSYERPLSSESTYTSALTVSSNATLSEIAETLKPAVVTVSVDAKSSTNSSSFGSGVCINAGGYILTNYHVVKNYVTTQSAYTLSIYLNNSYSALDATILWTNSDLDMAILQCEEGNIPFVNMVDRSINPTQNNELKLLEQVIAIGTPLDFSLQNWTTTGEIAKLNCYSTSDGNLYENLIGHTSPINHGNSGGPLFDLSGNLIGLNTLGYDDGHSVFFAVPIYPAMLVIDRIVTLNEKTTPETLKMTMMGITGYDALMGYLSNKTFTLPNDGMMVESVEANGPSKDLEAGDIITKVTTNGKTIIIKNRFSLIYALIASNPGDKVTIEYKRGGVTDTAEATLIEKA